jgi:hypothetical protein
MNEDKDYYVYVHRRKDNGVVFYVGHGRGNRIGTGAKTKTKDWAVIEQEANGHSVEKLNENLSKSEAETIEYNFLSNPPLGWQLVNKRLPVKIYELDYEYLNTRFEYSEESKTGLKWKGAKFAAYNGKDAGCVQRTNGKESKAYWCVRDGKRLYLNHRIVWVLFNKIDIPSGFVVDHIDGNSSNNNINNLRILTQQQNSSSKKNSWAASGISGVKRSKKANGYYWTACIVSKGAAYTRSYSVDKYGENKAKEMAIAKRLEYELEFQPQV